MGERSKIALDKIRIDGGTQSRVAINDSVVSEYAYTLSEGEELPPIILFFDGAAYWLADGYHRYHAHAKLGALDIEAEVRNGQQIDARLWSYGANRQHGLRRTIADKAKAVAGMLADFADWSDRKIASHVGVDHKTVGAHRAAKVGNSPPPATPKPSIVKSRPAAPASLSTINVPARENDDAPDFDVDESILQPGPAPAPAADVDGIDDELTPDELLAVEQAEVARLNDEVAQLRARVAFLESGSDVAQLVALERDRDGYRNSSTDHFNKWTVANKKAIDYKALLDKLCKIAGVTKYSELAGRIAPAARS